MLHDNPLLAVQPVELFDQPGQPFRRVRDLERLENRFRRALENRDHAFSIGNIYSDRKHMESSRYEFAMESPFFSHRRFYLFAYAGDPAVPYLHQSNAVNGRMAG